MNNNSKEKTILLDKISRGSPVVDFGFVFENVSIFFHFLFKKLGTNKNILLIKSKTFSKPKFTTGFAMLFAVLISSFLIMIGISIFSISLKEVMISTSIRDSQTAFYAADSAGECALYWDLKAGGKNSVFPSCLDSGCTAPSTMIKPTITCNGIQQQLSFDKDISTLTYSYSGKDFFKYSSSAIDTEPEADITISKTLDGTKIITTFDISGHNTGESGRRVERGITRIY